MKYLFYIITSTVLFGCGGGYEVTELYEQPINNSSISIMEYQAWSTINDGSKYGHTLKDSSEIIDIVEAKQMPFRYLTEIPTAQTIHTIELLKGGKRIPEFVSTEISTIDGIKIVTDRYKYSVGSSMNLTYKFETFEENDGVLIIKGLKTESFRTPDSSNQIILNKGNIKLIENRNEKGILESIEMRAFLLPQLIGGSIDKLTILRDESLKVTGQVNFGFIPNRKIKINEFSDLGFFKKKEITGEKKI